MNEERLQIIIDKYEKIKNIRIKVLGDKFTIQSNCKQNCLQNISTIELLQHMIGNIVCYEKSMNVDESEIINLIADYLNK